MNFKDLLSQGYLIEAIVNYLALLGWRPSDNSIINSLDELIKKFNIKHLSTSPSIFDYSKLDCINSKYIKKMHIDSFIDKMNELIELKQYKLKEKEIALILQTRINKFNEIPKKIDFLFNYPNISKNFVKELFIHKKRKVDLSLSLKILKDIYLFIENNEINKIEDYINESNMKRGTIMWPIRNALSGLPTSVGKVYELLNILNKEKALKRINYCIDLLEKINRKE